MSDIEVILWGDTAVGKTSALAALLWESERTWLDARRSEEALLAFEPSWKSLSSNRLPRSTRELQPFSLTLRDGRVVRVVDVMGGDTRRVAEASGTREALGRADAVLLFVEWPEEVVNSNIEALRNALLLAREGARRAVVLTKLEGHLHPEEFAAAARDPASLRSRNGGFADLWRVLDQFGRTPIPVFPISVYGYGADSRPAQYINEFGVRVPTRIRPCLIEHPFRHAFGV